MGIKISAVILAGGNNVRFQGRIKSNLLIGGKTIIARIIDTLKDLFDEIIIVSNTPEEFKEFSSYKIIGDRYLKRGPLGGIHSALKETRADALFIFAGDMPLLDKNIISRQLALYRSSKCEVLIPCIGSNIEPLHAVYNSSLTEMLEDYLNSGKDLAVRDFLKKVNVKYMSLKESEETRNAFTNINLPSDIPEIQKILTTH
jgi:molybdopterin-guanine dinucleotide biosynthesis protein A